MEIRETVFFIDRCLGGKKLSAFLKDCGLRVEVHDEHFAQDALDQDWIPAVTEKGWIILTKDKMIAKRSLEVLAVAESRARLFVLVLRQAPINAIFDALEKSLPEIFKLIRSKEAPFIVKIYRDGRIVEWKDPSELEDVRKKFLS